MIENKPISRDLVRKWSTSPRRSATIFHDQSKDTCNKAGDSRFMPTLRPGKRRIL